MVQSRRGVPTSTRQQSPEARHRAAAESLVANFVATTRSWFSSGLVDCSERKAWAELELEVAAELDRCRRALARQPDAEHWFARSRDIEQTFVHALQRRLRSSDRVDDYRRALNKLADDAVSWDIQLPPAVAAFHKHSGAIWLSFWHASLAGVRPRLARDIVLPILRPAQPHAVRPAVASPRPVEPSLYRSQTDRGDLPIEPVNSPTHLSGQELDSAVESAFSVPPTDSTTDGDTSGLGNRSVLDGSVVLNAANLLHSRAGLVFGMGISVLVGTLMFCGLMVLWALVMMNPFAAVFWLGAMPIAAGLSVLLGWIFAEINMMDAAGSVKRSTKLQVVEEDHILAQCVADISQRIGLQRVPEIGIYPGDDVNGFAVGEGNVRAVIGVSEAAFATLSEVEMTALIAHEVGHIASGDMLRMVYAQSFQGALVWWLVFSPLKALGRWVFSTIGEMTVLGISRAREYRADAFGAAVAGKANMIALLERLDGLKASARVPSGLSSELLFRPDTSRLFSTHPPTSDRIKAVQSERHVAELRLSYPTRSS